MPAAFDPSGSPLAITLVYLVLGAGALVLLTTASVQLRLQPAALRGGPGRELPLLIATLASAGLASVVGAALAVDLGGPGALPWMWLAAFLGMGLVHAEVLIAARSRGHDREGALVASPMRALREGLGGPGSALAALYALALVVCALGLGALLHGQQVSAVLSELAGLRPAAGALLLAALAAPLVLGTGPKIRRAALRALPAALAVYVAVALATLAGDVTAASGALARCLEAAFTSDAVSGGVAGGALTALTHAILRTTMSGPGLGVAALTPEIARPPEPEASAARAMLGPALSVGLVGTLTALTLVAQPADEGPLVERELVFLEQHHSRALLPSERGQTIVATEDTGLEEGKLYPFVLRSNPRGHKVGQLFKEENMVALPHWAVAERSDTVILRDRNPLRGQNSGYDVVIPCTREVVRTRVGPYLKLRPRDPTVNIRALINARNLDGPYVVLGDYHFVGAVERAVSGHPRFGEHLAIFEPEPPPGEAPYNTNLRGAFELGYRGPYIDHDEEALPPALVSAEGFLPEPGTIAHLRFEAPPRGLELGFLNRAHELETPAWDFLAATDTAILRHHSDPELDVEVPVVARESSGRLRFSTPLPGVNLAELAALDAYDGPYLAPPPFDFAVEVHGDARLPARFKGRRALIPIAPEGERRLPDIEALLRGPMLGPTLAGDGASALPRAWSRVTGAAGSWAAALSLLALGVIGLGAWAAQGAACARHLLGEGAGIAFRGVFLALAALGGSLGLAHILRLSDVSMIVAAELHLIGLCALLPRILSRRPGA
ncbi:MAG: alanine:cation symporter family protein [Myxococcales bacterium]|nr:alanine:cation symporter family protein [Myxococcales bacterium]